MRLKEYIKQLVRPEVFVLLSLLFLLAGTYVIYNPYFLSVNPNLSFSTLSLFVWLFALGCFLLGIKYKELLFKLKHLPAAIIFLLASLSISFLYSLHPIVALLFAISVFAVSYCVLEFRWNFLYLFALGTLAVLINFLIFGIPLLDIQIHVASSMAWKGLSDFVNPLFIFGIYAMLYSAVRLYGEGRVKTLYARSMFLVLIVLAAFSSFRVYVAIAFLVMLFMEMKQKKAKENRNTYVFLSAMLVAVLVFFLLVGHTLEVVKNNEIGGPIEVAQYRFGFSLHVFDDIVKKAFPFGHAFGSTYMSESGIGIMVCQVLYGCSSKLTSTAFGQAMLDFGLLGIFLMAFFLAAVLGKLYERDYPLYTIGIAHAIVAIEIGINIFFLLLFAILYLRLVGWNPLKRQD
ncbi:MAG: hypothetical protein ACE5J7_03395 [Candidatus Aenigmatarchaeota archaeon]